MNINDYQNWGKRVYQELSTDTSWEQRYDEYIDGLDENREKIAAARKLFHGSLGIDFYITFGNAKNGDTVFDIRHLGQSVGCLKIDKENNIKLSVDDEHSANSLNYFGYDVGVINSVNWGTDEKSKLFRKFYKEHSDKAPRQKEHMVESALFTELEKSSSFNKNLCYITPVSFCNLRFHLKTALKACKSKNDEIAISESGGEIDLLARRRVNVGNSRLVVIEIKDENKKTESFDLAIKQAISYTVFLIKLLRGNNGRKWAQILGMPSLSEDDKLIVDAVAAMPHQDGLEPSFRGEEILVTTKDSICLHYMELSTKINPIDIGDKNKFKFEFKHSF